MPYKLALLDASAHAVLIADGISGEIVAELSYPTDFTPVGLTAARDNSALYIPAAGNNGTGALFRLNPTNLTLYRLPLDLPHPAEFCLAPNGEYTYLADLTGAIHKINLLTLTLDLWGRPEGLTACCGLQADNDYVYAVWSDNTHAGMLGIFSHAGVLLKEQLVDGIPTHLALGADGTVAITFTAEHGGGEGVFVWQTKKTDGSMPTVITIKCPQCAIGQQAYPLFAAISADCNLLYVVNEDSASITIIDLPTCTITGSISVGRSISSLHLLPDNRFAIASSNAFADLSLIDLVNRRLLSMTDTEREFMAPMLIFPNSEGI